MGQIWFKPKRFGYGAVPISWQGWAVTLAGAMALSGAVAAAMLTLSGRIAGGKLLALGLAILAGIIAITLIIVTYQHTDGPWRWRGK